MFAIESIDTFLVDLPTIRPHVLSMATMMRQTAVFVRIRCADGIVGTGEASTIGGLSYGPESPEGIKLAIDTYFKPLLLKGDASRPALVMDMLGKSIVGNHFAKCAVETALLDAMGQRLGVPISELLGGRRRDSLPVAWTLPRKRQHRARYRGGRAHAGHPSPQYLQAQDRETQHRRGCRPCRRDQESRRRPRECAGRRQPGLGRGRRRQVYRDAAGRWLRPRRTAGGRAAMARLAQAATVPIMADEALTGPHSAFDYAASAAADVFAVKIQQSGGLHAACKVGAIADAAGIALYGGTMLEVGIATAASAQVFATFPKLAFQTELFGPLLVTEEILTEPLHYADFAPRVPDGPALGVTLDMDRVAFFRRDAARTSFHGSAAAQTPKG